jgi:hypothetical protein
MKPPNGIEILLLGRPFTSTSCVLLLSDLLSLLIRVLRSERAKRRLADLRPHSPWEWGRPARGSVQAPPLRRSRCQQAVGVVPMRESCESTPKASRTRCYPGRRYGGPVLHISYLSRDRLGGPIAKGGTQQLDLRAVSCSVSVRGRTNIPLMP